MDGTIIEYGRTDTQRGEPESVTKDESIDSPGKHGNHRTRLFKVTEEDGRVVALFGWESKEAFEVFSNDPRVRETMRSSGTLGPPEVTLLEKVGEFPA